MSERGHPKIGIFEFSGNIDIILFVVHELMPNYDVLYALGHCSYLISEEKTTGKATCICRADIRIPIVRFQGG